MAVDVGEKAVGQAVDVGEKAVGQAVEISSLVKNQTIENCYVGEQTAEQVVQEGAVELDTLNSGSDVVEATVEQAVEWCALPQVMASESHHAFQHLPQVMASKSHHAFQHAQVLAAS